VNTPNRAAFHYGHAFDKVPGFERKSLETRIDHVTPITIIEAEDRESKARRLGY